MTSSLRDTDVVSSLRLAIAGAIGNDRFELWFGRTTLSIHDEALIIEAPCDFTAHWLRSNFRQVLEDACQVVLGRVMDMRFQVSTESGPQASTPPAANLTDQETSDAAAPKPPEGQGRPQFARSPETPHSQSATSAGRRESGVCPKRKFSSLDRFVAGPNNQVALTSAQMIAAEPGKFSPLLIWGPTGTGKTHLLEGIWSAVRRQPRRRCLFLTSEQFTTFFLQALHGRGLPNFRRRYRDVDLLIIENVQFFAGKRATINELMFTIDAVLRDGHQLVFSADRAPADLSALGSDLVNRLGGGLVATVQAPDFESRIQILQQEAARRKLLVPQAVVHQIATNICDDVRRLQGALNRLEVFQRAKDAPISVEMAQMALADCYQTIPTHVHLRDIERVVCTEFDMPAAVLKSSNRTRNITQARMLAMWLARKHTKAALSEIGDFFGRSHSTVVSAEKRVNQWVEDKSVVRIQNADYRINDAIRQLENKIQVG